jgi:hypothetical protein
MFNLCVTLFLGFLYPILSYWDYRADIKEEKLILQGESLGRRIRNLSEKSMWLSPFIIVFYSGNFWYNLVFYFIPLLIYFSIVDRISYFRAKLNNLHFFLDRLAVIIGRSILAICLFYAPGLLETSDFGYWPFYISLASGLLVIFLSAIIKDRSRGMPVALVWCVGLLLLPFLSTHPFWLIGLNIVLPIVVFMIAMGLNSEIGYGIFLIPHYLGGMAIVTTLCLLGKLI